MERKMILEENGASDRRKIKMINKYNLGDKVKVKNTCKNDSRKEVKACIIGIELDVETWEPKYKIEYSITGDGSDNDYFGCIRYNVDEELIVKE